MVLEARAGKECLERITRCGRWRVWYCTTHSAWPQGDGVGWGGGCSLLVQHLTLSSDLNPVHTQVSVCKLYSLLLSLASTKKNLYIFYIQHFSILWRLLQYNFIAKCQYTDCTRIVLWCQVVRYCHHIFTPIIKHLITTTANKHPGKKSFIDKNMRKFHWHQAVHITSNCHFPRTPS